MPILVTLATIKILFKGGAEEKAGFLAHAALRERLEALPESSTRTTALAIADQLVGLAQTYDDATDAALSAYVADVEKYHSTADDLIKDLQLPDQLRGGTLPEVISLREQLVDVLSPEEWDQVFG